MLRSPTKGGVLGFSFEKAEVFRGLKLKFGPAFFLFAVVRRKTKNSTRIAAHRTRFQRRQSQAVRPDRMGKAHRRNHRRRRQGHFQTGKCRSAEVVVGARHEGRRLKIFLRRTKHVRARNLRAPAHPPHLPHDRGLGRQGRLFQQGGRRSFLRRTDLALREPIRRVQFAGVVQRRAFITNTASAKTPARATGFTIARPARPSAPRRNTNIRRAARASSSPSRTTWKTSCASPTAKRCSSNSAPAPAPTCRRSVPAAKNSAAAAVPAARCPS